MRDTCSGLGFWLVRSVEQGRAAGQLKERYNTLGFKPQAGSASVEHSLWACQVTAGLARPIPSGTGKTSQVEHYPSRPAYHQPTSHEPHPSPRCAHDLQRRVVIGQGQQAACRFVHLRLQQLRRLVPAPNIMGHQI